ncbi:MAG: calcium/sodium antiporter, partial [Gammaproteobacteria bacterium]|nr:calcium/sodium antiporter [Gammaproteobacteria bacterium]
YGADRFVTGSAQISRIFNISPLIIGLTIVGFSTSVPEVLVGTVAAIDGKTHIAVGNAIGSNIANMS